MVKPYPYSKSAYYANKYGKSKSKVSAAAKTIQRTYRAKRQTMFLKKYVPEAVAAARVTKYGKRVTVNIPKQHSNAVSTPKVQLTNYIAMGTLNQAYVPFPKTNAYSDRLTAKKEQHAFIKGIRFVRTFEFIRPNETEEAVEACPPIIMHWAVIQLKEPNVPVENWTAEIKKKFFRSFDDDFDRCEDFEDNGPNTTWNSTHNWLKMNPDGNFNILTHRKRRMYQKSGIQGLDYKTHPYLWHIDTWMRINKTFTYTNTDQAYPDNPLFEVYWYNTVTPTDYPFGVTNFAFVGTIRQHTVYFG